MTILARYRWQLFAGVMMFVGMFLSGSFALAQDKLTGHYIAPDRTFQFSYPPDWELSVADDGAATLAGEGYEIRFLGPTLLNNYGLGYATDPEVLVKQVINTLEDAEPQTISPMQLATRTGLLYTYLEHGRQGYLVAVPFTDGTIGVVDASRPQDDLAVDDPVVLTLLANFNSGSTFTYPPTLDHSQEGWEQAAGELEELGLIPTGYEMVFVESHAFFVGQGSFFTPLARDKPAADLVMGGQLTYTPGTTGYEDCVLAARIDIDADDTIHAYLDVGLNNQGQAFFFDYTGDETTASYGALPLEADPEKPHDFLMMLLDDRLTLYIDGQLVFENRVVEDRAGSFGLGLTGSGPGASCQGQNIWAVEIPYVQPGICEVSTASPVNLRDGPGTEHEAKGRLLPGTSVQVVGQTTGSDGYTWWLLADDTWVREDVVNEVGSCETVPDALDVAPQSSESAWGLLLEDKS